MKIKILSIIFALFILVAALSTVMAVSQVTETAATSRIIGDSLSDMKKQIKNNEPLVIQKAIYDAPLIKNLPSNMDDVAKIRFFENLDIVKNIDGVDNVIKRVFKGESGAALEIEVAKRYVMAGKNVVKMSQPLTKSIGEIDVLLADGTIIESKGWQPPVFSDLTDQLEKQVNKYILESPTSNIKIVRPDEDIYFNQLKEWATKTFDKVEVIKVGDIK